MTCPPVRDLAGFRVYSSLESGSKEVRADPFSAQVEAGNVKLVRGKWNDEFIAEAESFPNSDFCDMIDAATRAFHQLLSFKRRSASASASAPQLAR